MEILKNQLYRGANLRILAHNKSNTKTHLIFHLCFLKSVCISNFKEIGPILLGPVKDIIRIENVCNASISVIFLIQTINF